MNSANAPQTSTVLLNELPKDAQVVSFGHRSGAETHQACPRHYYFNYEYLGFGITPDPGPLYFAVGEAIHHGLAAMLLGQSFDECDYVSYTSLAGSAAFMALESDDLRDEQLVLIEGLLYAFYIYAYPGIRDNFEVICVETGAVEFVEIPRAGCEDLSQPADCVAIQSRPDAILRNKHTGEVAGWSWKTIDDPSDFRRSQLVNNLQAYMELYYGEKILEKLAGAPVTREELKRIFDEALANIDKSSAEFADEINALLQSLTALEHRARTARNIPTHIDYIQTVFLVKGPRKLIDGGDGVSIPADWGQTDEYGGYAPGKIYRQMSHLCYRYRNGDYNPDASSQGEVYKSGPNKGRPKSVDANDPNRIEESWAYRFYKPGNVTGSSLSTKWLTSQIQPNQIRDWVETLNRGEVYPSTMNDERNPHPLAKIIRFEEPLYKDSERALSHVRQQRERFVQIARNIQDLREVIVPRSSSSVISSLNTCYNALDRLFPQHLISCRTPYRCQYHDFCHSAASSQIDFASVPDGFKLRTPHHEFERLYRGFSADIDGDPNVDA